jgi:WD40-like Beta Propeller Repeat
MRGMVARQRLVLSAALAASVALLTACAKNDVQVDPPHETAWPNTSPSPGAAPWPSTKVPYAKGMLLVSDGTDTVTIGEQRVRFPTTVTDASWSPDGSRLAFVDADNNISTSRPDGTDRLVLTRSRTGVHRARPVWLQSEIVFTEFGTSTPSLMSIPANASGQDTDEHEYTLPLADQGDEHMYASSPSAAAAPGPGREFAFQTESSPRPEVWVADLNGRSPWSVKVANGTQPALSPDGTKLAYVDTKGQIEVVAVDRDNAKPQQITFGVKSPTHLVWTYDGTRLAFQTPTDIESVSAKVASGATSNPATKIFGGSGVPTFLGQQRDRVVRFTRSDVIATAIAASKSRWETQPTFQPTESSRTASVATLTGLKNLPVVLGGASSISYGPLLFTSGTTLDSRTKTELKRLFGKAAGDNAPEILILGGPDIVPVAVEAEVKQMGYHTTRLAGSKASEIAAGTVAPGQYADALFVANATNTAAIAAVASMGPGATTLLLTDGRTLPPSAKNFLTGLDKSSKVYALDADARAALASFWKGTLTELTGSMLEAFGGGATRAILVDRSSPADVLLAISLSRTTGAPVLAIDPEAGIDAATQTWLQHSAGSLDTVYIVDASGHIRGELERKVAGLVSGPLGYAIG